MGPGIRGARGLGARGACEGERAQGEEDWALHAALSRPEGILPYIARQCNAEPVFRLRRSPVDCALRPCGANAVKEIYKWMGIVLLLGFALMYVEYRFAKKKKEGFTPIDRQRIFGIFMLTLFFAALVGAVMWLSD
jgi:hypothetical protein